MTQREEYRQHHRKQLAYEQEYRAKALWALRAQKKPFIDAVRRDPWIIGLPPELLNVYTDLIKPDALLAFYTRLYTAIAPKEAQEYYRQQIAVKETMLGFGQSQTWLDSLQEWLRQWMGAQITQMTQYTKNIILALISEGLQNGDGYPEIIKRIEATGTDRVRAANIARTETNRALGWAKYEAIGKLR